MKYAHKFNGTKYRYGGKNPKTGFDCSGFICYVYKEINVQLPPSSRELSKKGKNISLNKVKAGDLLFFKGSNKKNKKVGHVALVTENKSGKIKMIHATTSKGVITETYNSSSYWTSRFLFAKRIIN
ncbi:MAG: C40 family peptidase [Candidatus Azobacteroides sp.]|nr:C40 family peptidase [Candidatus Azobacteroides sp.]